MSLSNRRSTGEGEDEESLPRASSRTQKRAICVHRHRKEHRSWVLHHPLGGFAHLAATPPCACRESHQPVRMGLRNTVHQLFMCVCLYLAVFKLLILLHETKQGCRRGTHEPHAAAAAADVSREKPGKRKVHNKVKNDNLPLWWREGGRFSTGHSATRLAIITLLLLLLLRLARDAMNQCVCAQHGRRSDGSALLLWHYKSRFA